VAPRFARTGHLATVVTIRGEIDAVNVDWVSKYIRRFIVGSNPVVIEMSDISQFAVAGTSLLYSIDEDCRAAGVEWILIASAAVTECCAATETRMRPRSDRALGTRSAAQPGDAMSAVVSCAAAHQESPRRRSLAVPTTASTAQWSPAPESAVTTEGDKPAT